MLRPIRIINFSCCIYLCVWLYQFKYAKSDLYDYGDNQKWKLGNNKKLKNKERVWKSDDLWIFKAKGDDMIYIENTSKAKVLQATSDGKVIQESLVEGKADQLWKKGEADADGYFTLQNSGE